MKILIVTQAVDKNDPVLGFFHRWVEEFAKRFEKVTVICLKRGEFSLPPNVRVLSLGKEEHKAKIEHLSRFYRSVYNERGEYDAVFVHMNQEYVLLAGILWKLLGNKVYLWRNHAKGSILTDIAAKLSDKVFYTSPKSYTARFKNAVKMPVGVDTEFFKPDPNTLRVPGSVLFLGRISPVKRVLEFVDSIKDSNAPVTIAGPILPKDLEYGEAVKAKISESNNIKYVGAVDQAGARKLYQTHEIYANMTPGGSFDKTIFEAAACGMKLRVENPDISDLDTNKHSLTYLMDRLNEEIR